MIRDAIADGIFCALFRVVSIADLEDPERAVEWPRSALDDAPPPAGFADGTRAARARRMFANELG